MLQYIARLIERLLTAVRVSALMTQAEGRELTSQFDSSKCNIHYMYNTICLTITNLLSFLTQRIKRVAEFSSRSNQMVLT